MSNSTGTLDVESAVRGPADYFARAIDVVNHPRLTQEDKLRILKSWALDAELLLQAEAENMPGKDLPRLREVKLALLQLEKRR